jgi:hypothetical protein
MLLSRSAVIPAFFWRESRKSNLDTRLRGYDEKTLIRTMEPKDFQPYCLPTLIEKLHKLQSTV